MSLEAPKIAVDDQEALLDQQISDLHEELDLAIINSRKTKKIRTNLNNLRRFFIFITFFHDDVIISSSDVNVH